MRGKGGGKRRGKERDRKGEMKRRGKERKKEIDWENRQVLES